MKPFSNSDLEESKQEISKSPKLSGAANNDFKVSELENEDKDLDEEEEDEEGQLKIPLDIVCNTLELI